LERFAFLQREDLVQILLGQQKLTPCELNFSLSLWSGSFLSSQSRNVFRYFF